MNGGMRRMDKEEGVMKGDQQTFFCHEFRKAALQTVELDLAIEQWVQELWLRPMACHRSHDKETVGRSESVCIVTFRRFILRRPTLSSTFQYPFKSLQSSIPR
ncbi:unnamed protein product [Lasius platythorax]|uniref:Uncharacterized protein n=1 Tax=Lasius platythorax TaxID=488582 RepID=A0AAV2P8V9_9HYME